MANLLTLKRLRETIAERMSEQRHAGGQAYVIVKNNGSVLSAKTGTFEFDLYDALEVPEGVNPAVYGGNKTMSKVRARVEVIKGLGQQAVIYDRAIAEMT